MSFFQVPTTEAEYLSDPSKYPKIMGVVTAGTTIQFSKADYMYGPEQRLFIFGRIADGKFNGLEVNLETISEHVARNRGSVKSVCLAPKS